MTSAPSSDLRIVLLGKNGAEISSAGNMILGRKAFKEKSRASEIQRGRVEDKNISVIDTPGFFNTELTDEDLQNEMMKGLSLSHPGPHVFLLIIRPDTFTEHDVRKIIEKLEENFGEQVFRFTLVLLIREHMSNRDWMTLSLSKKVKELIGHFSDKHYAMNIERDTTQIKRLFEKMEKIVNQNAYQHYKNNYKTMIRKQELKEKVHVPETGSNQKRSTSTSQATPPVTRKHEDKPLGVIHQPQIRLQSNIPETVTKSEVSAPSRAPAPPVIDAERVNEEDTQEPVKIVLLGKTGSGKSATGNTILGRYEFKEEASSVSVTTNCKKKNGRCVSVIDTPGIFGTSFSNDHVISEIQKCLEMSAAGAHVFLLVIRLDRFTEEEEKTVTWIKENCGDDASLNTIILFTHVDQLKGKPVDVFIKESTKICKLIDSFGGRYCVFNNNDKGNVSQVKELLEKIKQLVRRNGEHLYNYDTFMSARKNYRREQKRKEMEEMTHTFMSYFYKAVDFTVKFVEDRVTSVVDGIGFGSVVVGSGAYYISSALASLFFLGGFGIFAWKLYQRRNRKRSNHK